MKNFSFSRFLIFLLVVATALLAPSCNNTLKKASSFVDFNGTDTTEARYATAAPATDFEGIWLKVVDNGRVYPLPLCRVNYGRQTWYDENDGKWIGVTFYEDGYTWTEFYHSFKDEDDLDPTFVRTIITDDYLVCSGGDNIAFPWTADPQKAKTLTQFKVEGCRFGICELTTIVDGRKVTLHMDKRIVGQNRIPEPRPDRTPFCIATPNTNLVEGDFIGLETVCGIDSILSTTYVYEINDHITYIPDGRGGEWLLDTRPDTEIPTMYITTFYYRKYKDPLHVRVNTIVTTKYVTAQFKTAEKEGR